MSDASELNPLTDAELGEQSGTALPDKEVVSILDLNADLDLALDVAAPIDLAVAANANVAAPIDAAVGANILSVGSTATSLADQGVMIDQGITGDATANSAQDSSISTAEPAAGGAVAASDPAAPTGDASLVGDTVPDPTLPGGTLPDGTLPDGTLPDAGIPAGTLPTDIGGSLDGNLLNVDVNLAADAGINAPINGAVAANANVAAPIDAAVSANIGSIDSDAVAVAQQDAIISQHIDGDVAANADQTSQIDNP